MNTKTHSRPSRDYFLELVKSFPLKPIRTPAQYDRAGEVLSRLVVRPEGSLKVGEQDYMETLTMLIEAYDGKHARLRPRLTPLESLQFLLKESGLKTADLGKIIGSQPAASMILNGHREMSKSHIRSLAAYFNIEPSYFM